MHSVNGDRFSAAVYDTILCLSLLLNARRETHED